MSLMTNFVLLMEEQNGLLVGFNLNSWLKMKQKMKQKITACIAVACFLSISVNAQIFKGKTINAFGKPLPYANVCLLNHADSSFIQGAVSNDKGEFVINSEQREAILKVSLIGY